MQPKVGLSHPDEVFSYGDRLEEHTVDQLRSFVAGIFARFLFLLPACWLVYVLSFAAWRCHSLANSARQCAELIVVAPIISLLPSIVYDEDPPLSVPYLLIVLVAIGVAVIWTTIPLISTHRRFD